MAERGRSTRQLAPLHRTLTARPTFSVEAAFASFPMAGPGGRYPLRNDEPEPVGRRSHHT
jgi:hypothetical protein